MKLFGTKDVVRTRKAVVVLYDLRTIRAQLGLSLRDLAKLTGLTDAMLSYIETGKRHPSRASARKITNALHKLGVNVEIL